MVTHFITVSNGIITGQHCGDIKADFSKTPYHGHERVVIPQGVMVSVTDKIEFYTNDWQRKPDIQLINEGLMAIPEGHVIEEGVLRRLSSEERIVRGIDEPPAGYKVEDGEIVQMTRVERINAGLEELPKGRKIEGDEIVEMSLSEQLAAGQISQEDYDEILAAENIDKLQCRLAELQTSEVLAQAELDDAYAAERKAKLTALIAVKKQSGWPVTVDWQEFAAL